MESDQKDREQKTETEKNSEDPEAVEVLLDDKGSAEFKVEGRIVAVIETTNEDKKDCNNLTFVSSLTFANLIMEFAKTDKTEVVFEKLEKSIEGSVVPPPFSPFFNSPSSPSPSSTSLDAKGSAYGVELALLRREGMSMYTQACKCVCALFYYNMSFLLSSINLLHICKAIHNTAIFIC